VRAGVRAADGLPAYKPPTLRTGLQDVAVLRRLGNALALTLAANALRVGRAAGISQTVASPASPGRGMRMRCARQTCCACYPSCFTTFSSDLIYSFYGCLHSCSALYGCWHRHGVIYRERDLPSHVRCLAFSSLLAPSVRRTSSFDMDDGDVLLSNRRLTLLADVT